MPATTVHSSVHHRTRTFLIGGRFGVPGGANAAGKIADLIMEFSAKGARIVATRDYHPHDHISFLGNGPKSVFPPHCIEGSEGSKYYPPIKTALEMARRKSSNPLEQVRSEECTTWHYCIYLFTVTLC